MLGESRGSVLAVLLVAFAVRAAALWAVADTRPVLDERGYKLRAEALLDGKGFVGSYQSWVLHGAAQPFELPQYPGAWQPPGQTAFMAAVMALSGRSILAVKFVQVILSTLSVWLVYALGRAWFDARCGRAAAWIAALYPNLIAFSHYLWSETLFLFLLLCSLWLLTRRRRPPELRSALLGGALFGLGALTRGTLLYFLPLLLVWMVWAYRARWRLALGRAAIAAVVALLVVLPWTIRNTKLHGGLVLIETNGAYNLWRGNGPDAFAQRGEADGPYYRWPFDRLPLAPVGNRSAARLVEEAKQALGNPRPTDLQIVGYARAAAWQAIRSDPGAFLGRVRHRLVDLWNPTSFLTRHLQTGSYGKVPWVLDALVTASAILGYLLVMLFGCAGFWLARRRPEAWLVLLLAAFFSGISALAFGLTRFRLPLMPLVMVLASPAVVGLLGRPRRYTLPPSPAVAVFAALAALPAGLLACGGRDETPPPAAGPSFLWVVWDTVRADRLGLYGHDRDTAPQLDAWAAGARVFQNATSTAGYTTPSHASMFTGLLPSEHCTHNDNPRLDDRFTTLAELLRDAGWRTYLYSENPNVSADPTRNFAQGFQEVEHPWSPKHRSEALRIVREKLPEEDRSSELRERIEQAHSNRGSLSPWNLKAAGLIARHALLDWLEAGDPRRPWFAFLNYMEAHRPYIPPRRYRERLMTEQQIAKSYRVDRSWIPMWEYVFRLRDYTEEELELTRLTYDATLLELDDLFADLLEALERGGWLEDTVVILTSDHGEHLGEQHMLDHQYSVYEPVLRVPLVVHYPARFEPGRDNRPVVNFDVFPTILDLAGVAPPPGLDSAARSLLSPAPERGRLAEEPASSSVGIGRLLRLHPKWDPTPFRRRLRSWTQDSWKFIWRSDGSHSLFELATDPLEERDLIEARGELARELAGALDRFRRPRSTCRFEPAAPPAGAISPEQRERLRALGYLGTDD